MREALRSRDRQAERDGTRRQQQTEVMLKHLVAERDFAGAAALKAEMEEAHARVKRGAPSSQQPSEEVLEEARLARQNEMALQRLLDEKDYSGAAALQSKMREESTTTKGTAEGSAAMTVTRSERGGTFGGSPNRLMQRSVC